MSGKWTGRKVLGVGVIGAAAGLVPAVVIELAWLAGMSDKILRATGGPMGAPFEMVLIFLGILTLGFGIGGSLCGFLGGLLGGRLLDRRANLGAILGAIVGGVIARAAWGALSFFGSCVGLRCEGTCRKGIDGIQCPCA